MTADDRHNALNELLAKVTEGDMTADDRAALAERLRDDDEAREVYRNYINLHALLDWKLRQADDTTAMPSSAPTDTALEQPTPRRKSLLQWASRHPKGPAIAIAATLLIAALVVMGLVPVKEWIAGRSETKTTENENQKSEKSDFVARLTGWHADEWLEDSRPPLRDPRLEVGKRLVLASGVAVVTYNSGATVTLEGPSEYEVIGSNSGHLEIGKLTAQVNGEKAKGFTVETPTATVEDLGTEFGVVVHENRVSEVHVFEGNVRAKHGNDGKWFEVSASESLVVTAGGQIRPREHVARASLIDTTAFENLIVNGGFEASGSGAELRKIPAGAMGVQGWTQLSAIGCHLRGDSATFGYQPRQGAYCYHLGDNFGRGGIYQDVKTEVGQTYLITFFAAGYPLGNAEQLGRLSAGDLSTEFKARRGGNVLTDMGWTYQSFKFIATAETTRIQFENIIPASGRNAVSIDEIHLRRSKPEADIPDETTVSEKP